MKLRGCVYCGCVTTSRSEPPVCVGHRDLLLVDWRYAPELRQPTTAHWLKAA